MTSTCSNRSSPPCESAKRPRRDPADASDLKTLQDALVTESGVPAAIDHLLSLELIQDVERNGHWPGEEHVDHEAEAKLSGRKLMEIAAEAKSAQASASARKSRSKKKGTTISLVDTLQRRNTAVAKTSSRPSSRSTSRATSPSRVPSAPASASNAWGAVTSLAEYLSELIPEKSASYYQSYLHHPQFHSAYAAVKAALGEMSRQTKPIAHIDGPGRAVLEDIYGLSLEDGGDPNVRADLELCARTASEDVAIVMDLMDLLAEISEWPSDDDVHRQETWDHIGRTTAVVQTPPSTPPMGSRSLPGSPRMGPSSVPSSPRVPPSPLLPSAAVIQAKIQRAPANPERLLVRPSTAQPDKPAEKIIPGSKPPPSAFTSPTVYDDFGLPSNFGGSSRRSKSKDRQVHPKNWREVDRTRMRRAKVLHPLAASIPSYARGTTPHDSTPGSLGRPGQSTINDCLSHAQAERLKREEAIRAAGRHYHGGHLAGGKALNGQVAGHYALQAREATERAREWELKAARMIVGDQLDKSGHTIDLHHLTIHEATTVALESTARWYERQRTTYYDGAKSDAAAKMRGFTPPRPLVVVVGVGRHSAGNIGVIGPAVATALDNGGWRVDKSGRGYLVVRGRK